MALLKVFNDLLLAVDSDKSFVLLDLTANNTVYQNIILSHLEM